MINVTKTWLPDKEKYLALIDEIYENGWITNNGPLVQKLEKKLEKYLGVNNLVLVANGTIALEIAYRLLNLKGKVITTPFSFVATTSSLISNNLEPIFADINPQTFSIDTKNIENLITSDTSAIVPVHVFGNPCDVEAIQNIAKKHNLKVIYDAAHTFGIKYKDESILKYGDISTLSFHATKLFHTIEGGALIINDTKLAQKARLMINFGIDGYDSVKDLGTNAKMNEMEAAMGLCVLDDMEYIIRQREKISKKYKLKLENVVQFQKLHNDTLTNYSYFPILLKTPKERFNVQTALNKHKIYPRRYFHPSLDTLPYLPSTQHCQYSQDISSRILTLPLYPDLKDNEQDKIIKIILGCIL